MQKRNVELSSSSSMNAVEMDIADAAQSAKPTYWLTRYVILRLLGAVYAVAFLVAINQVLPLIGSHGLLPVGSFLQQMTASYGSAGAGFMKTPSVFWFSHSDGALLTVGWIGFLLSLVVAAGYANALVMALLWFLYMSFVHVGQEWYGYGWEIQLTETGFLAIFLCPLLDMRPFPNYAPPFPIIVLFRWLIFRIMLGAGLIKLRGDLSWRNGTALNYFFETQPIPNALSRWFHFLPRAALKTGVWFNWVAELVAPWLAFWPRVARHAAGIVFVLLQIFIMASGNLSFLNWLTIVPALACFDDGLLSRVMPRYLVRKADAAKAAALESRPMQITGIVVSVIIGLLSIGPAMNLLSSRQVMNTSFDPFDLVNTYGAFGSVGEKRFNVVFEGTYDNDPSNSAKWQPYLYKGLPVDLYRRPPQIAPYQLRLDWQMWFASMASVNEYPWTLHLVWKLLHNDEDATGLFTTNPFSKAPPRYIRAVLYQYSFAPPNDKQGRYWTRRKLGLWLPPLSATDPQLINYLRAMNWLPPTLQPQK